MRGSIMKGVVGVLCSNLILHKCNEMLSEAEHRHLPRGFGEKVLLYF